MQSMHNLTDKSTKKIQSRKHGEWLEGIDTYIGLLHRFVTNVAQTWRKWRKKERKKEKKERERERDKNNELVIITLTDGEERDRQVQRPHIDRIDLISLRSRLIPGCTTLFI